MRQSTIDRLGTAAGQAIYDCCFEKLGDAVLTSTFAFEELTPLLDRLVDSVPYYHWWPWPFDRLCQLVIQSGDNTTLACLHWIALRRGWHMGEGLGKS